jgi:hypothetical protein
MTLIDATLSPRPVAAAAAEQDALRGLSEDEACQRLAEAGPRRAPGTSRSYASIVRANVLTVFT